MVELDSDESLGLDKERSKKAVLSGFIAAIEGAMELVLLLESKALFQNPKSISSSSLPPPPPLLHVDAGLLLGGLICNDKSGCAGNNSI